MPCARGKYPDSVTLGRSSEKLGLALPSKVFCETASASDTVLQPNEQHTRKDTAAIDIYLMPSTG